MERVFQDNVELGCYVDGVHGIYMWKRIYTIAKDYGFEYECTIPQIEALIDKEERGELTSDMSGQIAHDLENLIDDYLNEKMAVDKAYWGRNENGDWGVWSERVIGDYLNLPFGNVR